ncbi:lysine exporter LysO family protein [Aminipila butyrica]|uniref:Lysine exporter LysO family protein n=1 Tax=Aminipila butyrica TaxID=433296 RepID=A0A858BUF3_9FIRM|nr:lysine exporter LysO family protein [Aminipila butyrica]QIB69207.1 lysine exporter LysO family protein [Aminipila butyrica]
MTFMPFICLAIGVALSIRPLPEHLLKAVDWIINAALIALMLTIGMNIGINDSVMLNLPIIGLNCVVISLSAIIFSVLLVYLVEKTLLPLSDLQNKLLEDKMSVSQEVDIQQEEEKKTSHLVWIMPVCIIAGVLAGFFLLEESFSAYLDYSLYGSLILLYTGVGISLGTNRKVFRYVKILGFKILYISLAIFLGSLIGGLLSGMVLGLPLHVSVLSAGGMSYYSITGAYMTQTYGIEIGTYGFMVNVMREFFTVVFLPVLIKISKGSPIAGGAAGNMDTMLVPVTKFIGPELGLVALITGVLLTFFVPFELPVLAAILGL